MVESRGDELLYWRVLVFPGCGVVFPFSLETLPAYAIEEKDAGDGLTEVSVWVPKIPPFPGPEGITVREQCNKCHREVRETVAGVCFECIIK